MTRNLLAKFKKPLQQSSRIVYESRISPDEQDWLMTSGHMTQTKKDSDRTSFYKSIAYNHQTNKIIQKIPNLIKENEELKFKVEQLEREIILIKGEAYRRNTQSIRDDQVFRKKVELENSMLKILKECRPLLKHKQRLYSSTGRFSTEAIDSCDDLSSRPHKSKQKNGFKLANSIFLKLQKERDQLKQQNQQLSSKLNQVLDQQQSYLSDIDQIKENFKQTLKQKQNLALKQQQLYQQQIGVISLKLTQISSENQMLKLRDLNLSEKVRALELEISKLKDQSQINQAQFHHNLIDCRKQSYYANPQGSSQPSGVRYRCKGSR